MKDAFHFLLCLIICAALDAGSTFAQESKTESKKHPAETTDTTLMNYDFPQIDIIGSKPGLINRIPGSAVVVSNDQIKMFNIVNSNEAFRILSGVNTVDEEGIGLRANIGIRGLDPDRSRTVLMLEDGVPISLAPYGEPEMYYTPAMERMSGLELLKGSGSILFGPQTIGGVVNYVTSDPPEQPLFGLNMRAGGNGYVTGQLSTGNTVGNFGVLFNYLHKQADKLGTLDFNVNDLTGKLKFELSSNSVIGLKISYYDEVSNSTYIGLTQNMYEKGDYYQVIAPYDKLKIRRYSASLTHEYGISRSTTLKTTVFGYTTVRNWLRQDFSRTRISNPVAVFGDTSIAGGAIYMRNSTGNRDRQFEVGGIEPRIYSNYKIGNVNNELEGGLRFLYERAFEQRINGKKADAESGDLVEDEVRTGYAYTAFVQNRTFINNSLSVIPGLRLESFRYEREIDRLASKDTLIVENSDVFSVIPGIGINYNLDNRYTFFAGIHRGFAPPRIKDAITNGGVALDLDAELSWNSELGLRMNVSDGIDLELTGYMMNFSNQIIPVSESSGASGTGLVNGGETRHIGVEAGIRVDFGKLFRTNHKFIVSSTGIFGNSVYSADRFISSGSGSVNVNGNELPYAPSTIVWGALEYVAPTGLSLQISARYTGEQFTNELNTVSASANGETGLMPSFTIIDFTGRYFISSLNSTFYLSVKNLSDERYISSRRPQGIKVGLPRLLSAGFDLSF
jgi:Fe(3+) dicitrate transport protein